MVLGMHLVFAHLRRSRIAPLGLVDGSLPHGLNHPAVLPAFKQYIVTRRDTWMNPDADAYWV